MTEHRAPAARTDVLNLLVSLVDDLINEEASDVVYREVLEGRLAVRMLQQAREATTVWCAPGERTVTFEATVIPAPVQNAEVVFRQCLVRSAGTWLVHYAIDKDGAVMVRGRVDVERIDALRLSHLLAEIWDQVERSYGSLVHLAFPSREK